MHNNEVTSTQQQLIPSWQKLVVQAYQKLVLFNALPSLARITSTRSITQIVKPQSPSPSSQESLPTKAGLSTKDPQLASIHTRQSSLAPALSSHICTRENTIIFHYFLYIKQSKQSYGFQCDTRSLPLSQEQVLPLLIQGFFQTRALLVFLGKTLTLTPCLNQHKNSSALDKSAKYNEEENTYEGDKFTLALTYVIHDV